jgi:AcrR family transcriptional regulator
MGEPARAYNSPRLQARRENILRTARHLLARHGYDGVTMHAIADEAGVVKKTLYNTFGSKDQLLLSAVGEVISGYRQLPAGRSPGIDAIFASRRAAVRQVLTNPNYAQAMTIALVQAEDDHPLVGMLLRESVAFTHSQLVTDAQRLRAEIEPLELAEQITAQGWGVTLLLLKGVISIEAYERKSLAGLELLLHAATIH